MMRTNFLIHNTLQLIFSTGIALQCSGIKTWCLRVQDYMRLSTVFQIWVNFDKLNELCRMKITNIPIIDTVLYIVDYYVS